MGIYVGFVAGLIMGAIGGITISYLVVRHKLTEERTVTIDPALKKRARKRARGYERACKRMYSDKCKNCSVTYLCEKDPERCEL